MVSAKQGLLGKQSGDAAALAGSGMAELESALARDLASEKRAIVLATGRSRAMTLAAELLYHSELEHKALLMPEQDLKHKIADFEQSVSRFEGRTSEPVGLSLHRPEAAADRSKRYDGSGVERGPRRIRAHRRAGDEWNI